MPLQIAYDLRAQLNPVRDQGRRPTCLAFATSAAHEHLHEVPEHLSPQWLYYHAIQRGGGNSQHGTSPEAIGQAVRRDGQPTEEQCPYSQTDEGLHSNLQSSPELVRAATVPVEKDSEVIAAHLKAGTPLVTCARLDRSFYQFVRDGEEALILDANLPPLGRVGHAMTISGYGDLNGDAHLLLRNSWGQDWGSDGYAWISAAHHKRLVYDLFVMEGTE